MDPGSSASSPSSRALVLRQTDSWLLARNRFLEDLTPDEKVLFTYASPENLFYNTSNDERENKNSSKMRAVSRSLEPLIDVIQEYGKAMDVYSNASSAILCPLWGSIRVLMVLAQSYGKFFEMIVEELRVIGEVLPRLNVYKELYPQYESLRQALTTAYLDVITICTRYRSFLREQKPTKRFLRPFNPRATSSFKSSVDTFKQHEKSVRMQVDICHKIEDKKTSDMLRADKEREIQAVKEEKRRRLLKVLSSVNTKEKHERIRRTKHSDSCKWIFSTMEYQSWVESDNSAVLCCDGIPGCGKSVLASSVIDSLVSLQLENNSLAYYYCDYAEKVSLEPVTILGALAQSLLSSYEIIPQEVADLIQTLYQDGERTPDTNEVFRILLEVVQLYPRNVLVLDGIDEVEEKNFYSILSLMKELLSAPKVVAKIFVTSREHNDLLSVLSPATGGWHQLHVDQPRISNDIEAYVQHSVELLMASKRSIFNTSHTEIMREIAQRLIQGANGMFLWVKYQLDELCLAESEKSFMETLRNLPKDLDETYHRLLEKIERQSERKELTQRMFEWIIAARRPLSESELCEGIAFTIEDRRWDAQKIPPNLSRIVRAGGNLVVFDKITRNVRLAHYTVQQYFLRCKPFKNYQFTIQKANDNLASVCIAYLSFEDFERHVVKYADNGINAAMKSLELIASPISPNRSALDPLVMRHRLGFSKDINSLDINHSRHVSTKRTSVQPSFGKFALLEYARKYWLLHSAGLEISTPRTRRDTLFLELVTEKSLPFPFKPWPDIQPRRPYPDLLGWAIANDHVPIVESLKRYDMQFKFENCIESAARWFFNRGGSLVITIEMLQTLACCGLDVWNPNIPVEAWIYHKILIAAQRGNCSILTYIKDTLGKTNDSPFVSPLWCLRTHINVEAAGADQHEIIDLFMNANNEFNELLATVVYEGQNCNAIERAALSGHVEMVKRLGKLGWAPNNVFSVTDFSPPPALGRAISSNDSRVLEALFALFDFRDPSWELSQEFMVEAFLSAVSLGHTRLVDIFLQYGIDAAGLTGLGICPYMQAIQDGNFEIFRKLFPLVGCGVGSNATGNPLTMAAANNRIEIANFLIANGAPINEGSGSWGETSPHGWCPTPLYVASLMGHYNIVKLLLTAGAKVNKSSCKDWRLGTGTVKFYELPTANTHDYSTLHFRQYPLSGAASNGHTRVVEQLLESGASPNPNDSDTDHPLFLAAIGGHSETVDTLLSAGSSHTSNEPTMAKALLVCSRSDGKEDILRLLLKCGVDIQSINSKGSSGLHIAADLGFTEVMKQFIKFGADVNARDNHSRTPIIIACTWDDSEAVKVLIAAGADLTPTDCDGLSAMVHTIMRSNTTLLKLLLQVEGLVNLHGSNGRTPLIEACLVGNAEVVKILLENKADAHARICEPIPKYMQERKDAKDIPKGSTSLMIAAILDDFQSVALLLKSDSTILDEAEPGKSCTSIFLAAKFGSVKTYLQLVKAGANMTTVEIRHKRPGRSCFHVHSSGLCRVSLLESALNGGSMEIVMDLLNRHHTEAKLGNLGLFSGDELRRADGYSFKTASVASKLSILIKLYDEANNNDGH